MLLLALGAHHVHQLGVPAVELMALSLVTLAVAGQDEPFYALHVYTCSTDEVLHLPHVEQVLDDVLLALGLSYVHRDLLLDELLGEAGIGVMRPWSDT